MATSVASADEESKDGAVDFDGMEKLGFVELDPADLDPSYMQWSEALKARLFSTADKDGNYFSYMFLDKIFGESRPCKHCGARGGARLPDSENSLKLYIIEEGVIGKHNIQCAVCKQVEIVVSGDDPSLLPTDSRLEISGVELRDLCKKITHFEVLHDLMEMLQIAAIENKKTRSDRHYSIAAFMIRNVRKICEEWCRPENIDLRQRKFLRLREETLLTKYKPTFTPDTTEEYREMYDMMAQSFRENREKMQRLLHLIKCHLIDNPTRSSFMTWVGVAMMQSENYDRFKKQHDPKSFMKLESKEFQNLKDSYLSLDVPLGVKKIPVVFMLFEVPRFYHYSNFLNQRLGKKRSKFSLTDKEKEQIEAVNAEYSSFGLGRAMRRNKKKTMVSPEAHLSYLSQQEVKDREKLYKSSRDQRRKDSDEELERVKNKSKSKRPVEDGNPPNSPSVSPPVNEEEEKPSADGGGLSKAQLKRRRKKAMLSQKNEDEESTSVAKEDDGDLSLGKDGAVMEKELQKTKVEEEKEETQQGKNEAVNMANNKKEVEPKLDKKKTEAKAEPKKDSGDVVTKKGFPVEVPYADRLPERMIKEFKDSFIPQGTKEYEEVVAQQPNIPDVDDVVVEAVKWALVKKKADRGEKVPFKSTLDVMYNPGIEELADSIAFSTLKHNDDNDDGTKSLERFLLAPSSFDDLPFFKWNDAMPNASKGTGGSKQETLASKSGKETTKKVHSEGASKETSKAVSKDPKSHSSQPKPNLESDMAKSPSEASSSGKGDSGRVSSGASASKNVASSEGASGSDSARKVTVGFNSSLVLTEEVYSEYRKGMNASIKVVSAGHMAKKADSAAADSLVSSLLKDLSQSVKADTVKKEEKVVKKKKEKETETSKYYPLVSLLADPFSVSRNTKLPSRGALMFLIQERSKVRHPMDKKPKSVPEDATRRLTELVRSAGKKSVEHLYDYHFRLVEFQNLPTIVRRMASRESTGAKFEKMELTSKEYRELVACSNAHGKKMVYKTGEPVARLVIMCLPLELGMPEDSLVGLAKDVFRVPCNNSSVEIIHERDSQSESDSDSASTPGGAEGGATADVVVPKGRNASRRARREAVKNAKKVLQNPGDHHSVMVTQMDRDTLRKQGFKVKDGVEVATVLANKEGVIFHVMDGDQTPEEVRQMLAKKYTLVSEKQGHGYFTIPSKDRPGAFLVDPKMKVPAHDDVPRDKFQGNRKKLKSKKKAIQDMQFSSVHKWPVASSKSKTQYAEAVGEWTSGDGEWPEGLPYGTEDYGDKEVVCGPNDGPLVEVLEKDEFGNHSMLKHLELNVVDAPDEAAAETVMIRYMEPADLGRRVDPKVPRYLIPSSGTPAFNKKLPLGTRQEDVPIVMKLAAPHNQMRALDAFKMPYKYEMTQLLTPHVDEDGEPVPDFPKRIAILSKLTFLPKSRYDSKQFEWGVDKETDEDGMSKEEKMLSEEERGMKDEDEVKEMEEEEEDLTPKLSKSKRKKLKKKMKELEAKGKENEVNSKEETRKQDGDVNDSKAVMPDPSSNDNHVTDTQAADNADSSSSSDSQGPIIARKKFKYCDNCGKSIESRIQLCAGCKRVAYCNYTCQKAKWKIHKKVCAYALRKDGKESTG